MKKKARKKASSVAAVLRTIKRRTPIEPCQPFRTKKIIIDPAVRLYVSDPEIHAALLRFFACDWGDDITRDEIKKSNAATRRGQGYANGVYTSFKGPKGRSRRPIDGVVNFWIIADLYNSVTYVKLPGFLDHLR